MSRPRSHRSSACRARHWRRNSLMVGVPERERKMRAQQLWHWLYVRGAREFDDDDERLEGVARARSTGISPRRGRKSWPSRFRSTARANGCSASRRNAGRAAASGRMRLHPGDRPRHALRLEPGRLHAQLLVLPYRHAEASCAISRAGEIVAQVMIARDRLGDFPAQPAEGARPMRPRACHQYRDDGHGRAALQFRSRQ